MSLPRLAALAPFFLVAACGGGGGGGGDDFESEPTAARGFYVGTTNTGRAVEAVVLSNGTYWAIYSTVANDNVVAGVLQGRGSTSGTSFTSSNGRDFNLEGLEILPFSLDATFAEMASLSGTADYTGPTGNVTFSAVYDDSFELTPSLATVATSYSGTAASSAGAESATFTITSGGAISGSGSSGCTFSGTVAPRTDGNVYDITVKFNGGPCVNGTETIKGIAVYDATAEVLTAAALNGDRDDGVIFVGSPTT